jgi:hypothetical protein
MISDTIYEDAWQEISTEFSPVYECGARKTLTTTSSITRLKSLFDELLQVIVLQLSILSYIKPNFNVYPGASLMLPLRHVTTLSAISNASGPLTLITEMAPVPGTVAGAQIVSSFLMYMFSKNISAKIEI